MYNWSENIMVVCLGPDHLTWSGGGGGMVICFVKKKISDNTREYLSFMSLQLVNLHRNRRYLVIKLHTWFCLSYFLKTNIKFYCIYQYSMSINSFFQHRICFSTQPQLQLVNLHRNRRYFVIKLHTWFFSIIFLEDKHKIVLHLSIFYEYQQFFQHRICFLIQPPDYSDPWPRLARSNSFFLIMLFNDAILVSL